MQVEVSLAEMLINAISAGRIRHVMLKRSASLGNASETAEDIAKVIGDRIDSACRVARENGHRQISEELNGQYVRRWQNALKLRPEWLELCELCGLSEGHTEIDDVLNFVGNLMSELQEEKEE